MIPKFEKGLPANVDAERFVLGSAMLLDDAFADVAGVLSQEDFSLEKHRRIFARIKDLYDRGEKIDRVIVADELKRHGQLESIDGYSYLSSLDEGLPALSNLDSYIGVVKEKSTLRQVVLEANKIIQRALNEDISEELLDTATAVLDRLKNSGGAKNNWITPYQVLERDGAALLNPERGAPGLRTPWTTLTEMTGGFKAGDLIVVAGRTSMGKTVVGLQQAYTTARDGIGVAYLSLEMTVEDLTRRLIAGISRVDSHRARNGYLSSEERRRQQEAAANFEGLPLYIDATRSQTPASVSATLRKLRSRSNIGLVVVDHLQLMKTSSRVEFKRQELSDMCHGFKRLAGEIGCAVLLLSQLNRACESERRPPILSDLKETGSIEEDADTVAFIHRPEMYKRDDPSLRGLADLIVAKQRNGPTGKIPLTFLHGFQVFEEAVRAGGPE